MDYRIELMVNGRITESILIENVPRPEQALHRALNINKYISVPSFNAYVIIKDEIQWE